MMLMDVLVFRPDGTQTLETREVLEEFPSPEAAQSAE